jgi:hypothetical protein
MKVLLLPRRSHLDLLEAPLLINAILKKNFCYESSTLE